MILAESPVAPRETFDAFRSAGTAVSINGPWTLTFVKGGLRLPSRQTVNRLVSWTTLDADAVSGADPLAKKTEPTVRPKVTTKKKATKKKVAASPKRRK